MAKKLDKSSMLKKKEFTEKLKEEKVIPVSVDPGFNGYKIGINDEKIYHINSLALVEKNPESRNEAEIVISIEGAFGAKKDYVMGSLITKAILRNNPSQENEAIHKDFMRVDERFGSESFAASYLGALYAALYEYATMDGGNSLGFKVSDLTDLTKSGFRIVQCILLPDHLYKENSAAVKKLLTGNVKGTVSYKGHTFELTQSFSDEDIITEIQARAPYDTAVYTSWGSYKDESSEMERKSKLPTLIIISGQRTLEQYLIDDAERISKGNENVPTVDFGMERVYSAVAEQINNEFHLTGDNRRNERQVEEIVEKLSMSGGKPITGLKDIYIRYNEMPDWDGEKKGSVAADVFGKWQKEVRKQVAELIEYIDKKFNLDTINGVYVCGGTGALYYDYIREGFAGYANLRYIDLIPGYCDGEDIGALYTVMYGGYCKLAAYINSMILEA